MKLYVCVLVCFAFLLLVNEIAASSSYYKKCKNKKSKRHKRHHSSHKHRSGRKHRGSSKRAKTVVTVHRREPTVVRIREAVPLTKVGTRKVMVGQRVRKQRRPTVIRSSSVGTAKLTGGSLGRILNNGRAMDLYAPKQLVRDAIGTTWINVEFGNIDVAVNKIFLVESEVNIVVRVVDLFCTGDMFDVYAISKSKKTFMGTTSAVQSDNCETTTADADHAWEHGQWSRGEFVLNPGRYKVMLVPHSSPYGGGSAAIRFDEEDEDASEELLDGSEWESADETATDESTSGSDDNTSDSDSDYYSSSDSSYDSSSSTGSDGSEPDDASNPVKQKAGSSCKGTDGFTVVWGDYKAGNIKSPCRRYGAAAVITDSLAHKRAVLETLKACVNPGTSLWIASFAGRTSNRHYAVTLESDKTVNVAQFSPSRKFAVLCLQ